MDLRSQQVPTVGRVHKSDSSCAGWQAEFLIKDHPHHQPPAYIVVGGRVGNDASMRPRDGSQLDRGRNIAQGLLTSGCPE